MFMQGVQISGEKDDTTCVVNPLGNRPIAVVAMGHECVDQRHIFELL